MHARPEARLADIATPWQSGVGGGPLSRGYRAGPDERLIHFLSGNGFSGGVYWPFLRRLLPEFGLFLHDIEGQGGSVAPTRFSGVTALTERIPMVVREQGLATPLIGMGHSFGAALTLKIAAEHPGLFRALVLLDPIVLPPVLWMGWRALGRLRLNPMARSARTRRASWPSSQDVLDALRGRGIYRGWTEEALQGFVEHATRDIGGQRRLCCPPELEAQVFEHPVYPWPAFRRVRLPILFLSGAQSYSFLRGAARHAQRLNPNLRVQTVPGGHCFMQQDPERAARAVQDFLRTLG